MLAALREEQLHLETKLPLGTIAGMLDVVVCSKRYVHRQFPDAGDLSHASSQLQ